MRTLGSLDFAGGSPVHIASGAAGLAYAIVTGKRHGFGQEEFKPHNLSSVFLGTALLWFGWFGFKYVQIPHYIYIYIYIYIY
jgi:Amt family ammonium transporter